MSKKKVLTVMLTLLVAVCLLATSALAVAPTTVPTTAPTAPTTDPTTPTTEPTAPTTDPTAPTTNPTTNPTTDPTNPSGTTDPAKLVFTDITEGAWYYDAVIWAVENNITHGTSTTTFSPAKGCTRAEMIEFLWNCCNQPKAGIKSVPFTDVPASGSNNYWYEDSLLWAYEAGIVAGTNEEGTTFSPNRVCTRAEMLSFIVRLIAEDGDELAEAPFTDLDENAWYYDDVLWAWTYGLTAGTNDGTTFSPNKVCTRAEAVEFLYNTFAE